MRRFPFFFLLLVASIESFAESKPLLWPEEDHSFVTSSQEITIGSERIAYDTVLGALPIRDQEGGVLARMFFCAYFKKTEGEKRVRPITFVFNGGPGSASIWLHIGGIGPKTILPLKNPSDRFSLGVHPNPETILDATDLVFIDALGTGFSHVVDEKKGKSFYTVEGDIKASCSFIGEFLSVFKKWDCPKYLLGESYGTLRCGGMAKYMHTDLGIFLDGVILISPALNYEVVIPLLDNSIFFATNLPSYATTCWYHKKISRLTYPKVSTLIKEVKLFCADEYIKALFLGDAIAKTNREQIEKSIASFTGISLSSVQKEDMRISDVFFMDHFFSTEKKTVGRMDSRVVGYYIDPDSIMLDLDPSVARPGGVLVPSLYAYMQNELGLSKNTLLYKIIAEDVNEKWDYSADNSVGYPNITSSLRGAFFANPQLKIFVGSGIYDLAVPFAGAEYILDHFLLPPSMQSQCSLRYYNAGHMMYLDEASRQKLKKDLLFFYQNLQGERDSYEVLDR